MSGPTEYRVIWEIDIFANTPLEAAQLAREVQLDPDTTAVVFEVKESTVSQGVFDLMDPTNEHLFGRGSSMESLHIRVTGHAADVTSVREPGVPGGDGIEAIETVFVNGVSVGQVIYRGRHTTRGTSYGWQPAKTPRVRLATKREAVDALLASEQGARLAAAARDNA